MNYTHVRKMNDEQAYLAALELLSIWNPLVPILNSAFLEHTKHSIMLGDLLHDGARHANLLKNWCDWYERDKGFDLKTLHSVQEALIEFVVWVRIARYVAETWKRKEV